jgi:hypothetical protein
MRGLAPLAEGGPDPLETIWPRSPKAGLVNA